MKKMKHKTRTIKSRPEAERPREKLLGKGQKALSDEELLAILLRVGVSGQSAIDLARNMIERFGGLSNLMAARYQELMEVKGIGKAKAAQILAAFEIVKRQLRERLIKRKTFKSSKSAFDYLKSSLGPLKKEVFKVLYLNAGNQLIDDEDLFQGTLNEAAIYPREVAKQALDKNAYAVIFAHNHPSGLLQVTDGDITITRKLIKALNTCDIKVWDHVIVAGNRCLSMKMKNLVEF